MRLVVSPETHSRLTLEATRLLTRRDLDDLGRRASPVERIATEAIARADARSLVDDLVALLSISHAIQQQDRVVV